ncbi:hypothetical protein R1flu_006076 [Riccia fluitans]|uniref:Uncharacterized protein n=1 Tax=Riccia fluitans TaxID=41844 RepID=A0ABD1YZ22_9MARC
MLDTAALWYLFVGVDGPSSCFLNLTVGGRETGPRVQLGTLALEFRDWFPMAADRLSCRNELVGCGISNFPHSSECRRTEKKENFTQRDTANRRSAAKLAQIGAPMQRCGRSELRSSFGEQRCRFCVDVRWSAIVGVEEALVAFLSTVGGLVGGVQIGYFKLLKFAVGS